MNRMRHGRFTIELPDGWSDQSTLLFVGPPPATLPTATKARVPQPSIAVMFVRVKGDKPPVEEARAILDEELQGLRMMSVGLEVLRVEEFDTALGRGVISTQRLTLDGVRLSQQHAVVVVGQMAVRAVASSGELDAKQDAALRAVLASVAMEKQQ